MHLSFYILHGPYLSKKPGDVIGSEKITYGIFAPITDINIKGVKYTEMRLDDYFDIELGGKDEIEDLEEGNIPIVSTSEFMNGVTSYKKPPYTYKPPVITVATDGSTCSSFVQEYSFYAFYKVAILKAKKEAKIPLDALYYISYLLKREKWRYVYARKFGKGRLSTTELIVPSNNKNMPDFEKMAAIVQGCKAYQGIHLYRKATK